MSAFIRNCLLVFVSCSALVGCGESGPTMGTVQGKLTVDGAAPTERLRVLFFNSMSGQGAYGISEADGSFALHAAVPTAEYKVFFEKFAGATSDEPVSSKSEIPTTIDRVYLQEDSSPLKFTVQKGQNTFDIDLQPPTKKGK